MHAKPPRPYYTPRHPRTLLANRIGGCIALAGVALMVAFTVLALATMCGLLPAATTAAFGWYGIPCAAVLLAWGGLLFAVTASHAY